MLSQSLRVLSVRDQASICPFALREVSVLAELALGHLRYFLTDVPPQSNSPPGGVLGIRIAPGTGPADTPRTRTATFDGRPHADGRGPRFDARIPRLVLNATGISTAARRKRAQSDGTATAPRAGSSPANRRPTDDATGRRPKDERTRVRTARSALPSKWGNDASSGISRSARRRTAETARLGPGLPLMLHLGMSPNNARLESSSTALPISSILSFSIGL